MFFLEWEPRNIDTEDRAGQMGLHQCMKFLHAKGNTQKPAMEVEILFESYAFFKN